MITELVTGPKMPPEVDAVEPLISTFGASHEVRARHVRLDAERQMCGARRRDAGGAAPAHSFHDAGDSSARQ